ncbi:MAG: ATP-binding cassette domain-containing protein [Alphaproteobacteria bacterium]|jgi:peptide/nickel transport system ATP-binding protein/oligopeptide transport system ATP-binding protein|nr:ATP-binding cassette domain-containing protein [Alphaproteobacteria bacterium]
MIPVLELRDLAVSFPGGKSGPFGGRGKVKAVDGVSLSVAAGETLGLVGESGCGKSSLAKAAMRLVEPAAGQVLLAGTDITRLGARALRPHRRRIQMVFQDPYSSLDPRQSAGDIVGEPLLNYRLGDAAARRRRVAELFDLVGLRPDQTTRYPHEFSGGQRQRLGIARALALGPDMLVADEPVSALDVSIQAQVINLMMDLQGRFNLGMLFVSHDLSVVRHVSRRVAIMYLGRIVEIADTTSIFGGAAHPYTQALLAAAPVPDPVRRRRRILLKGDLPSPLNPPAGCPFHTRCPVAIARCRTERPRLSEVATGHRVACHLVAPAKIGHAA